MGRVPVQLLLLLAFTVEISLGISHEIHLLRPQAGSGGQLPPGCSCLSWRLAVETNNIIDWGFGPLACRSYVRHYMFGQQYRKDSAVVVHAAITYAESLKLTGDGRDIWVFDIDETSLSNLPYFAANGLGAEPHIGTYFNLPALPESVKLYNKLLSLGIKIVFLTGRLEADRNATAANLHHVGYHTWEKLILKPTSLNGTINLVFKSHERKMLEESGYRIVGNIGDQWSDILGTNVGNRTFKLPNPLYYVS